MGRGTFKDITGQRFGKLVAIRPTEERKGTNVVWEFKCDCGNTCKRTTTHLTDTSSCGCSNWSSLQKDITGQRFGRLVALRPTNKKSSGGRVWEFQCDCGNIYEVAISAVTSGNTTSCGCVRTENVRNINFVDLTGRRFGMLEVVRKSDRTKQGDILWECLCDCGNSVLCTTNDLNAGHKLNCGCNPNYKFYCVYKHVFPDGRVYIGKTSKMPLLRWHTGYKSQYEIKQAIEAIGDNWIDSIQHYYLSSNGEWTLWNRDLGFKDTNLFSISGASRLEKKWIAEYDATNVQKGLNATTGGDKGFTFNTEAVSRSRAAMPDRSGENSPFYGKKMPEETKRKLSEKAKQRIAETGVVNFKGKHHNEETKSVLREKALERDAAGIKPFKGKHHKESTKKIISDTNSEPVTQYTLDGKKIKTYKSATDAANDMSVTVSSISACVNGHTKSSGGYIWRHEDMDQLLEGDLHKPHGKARPVLQLDKSGNVIARYESVNDAAKAVNHTVTSICTALKKGGEATAGGYLWRYEDGKPTSKTKTVIQLDTEGNTIAKYNSVKEAAVTTGFEAKGISGAARGNNKTYKGFVWKYE